MEPLLIYVTGMWCNNYLNNKLNKFCGYKNVYKFYDSVPINLTRQLKKLEKLIVKHDWSFISGHPDLTLEHIANNPGLPWCWTIISKHPNMTWDIITANASVYPWDWISMLDNPNITHDIYEQNTVPHAGVYRTGQRKKLKYYYMYPNHLFHYRWQLFPASSAGNYTNDTDTDNSGDNANYYITSKKASADPKLTWDIIESRLKLNWNDDEIIRNKFTEQVKISMVFFKKRVYQCVNYLARYNNIYRIYICIEHY